MIKFHDVETLAKRTTADLLVIPFWKEKTAQPASSLGSLKKVIEPAIKSGDFSGKVEETLTLYLSGQKEMRLLLVGLGEKKSVSEESLRRSYGAVTTLANKNGWTSLNVILPSIPDVSTVRGISEGVLHANYSFTELKGDKKKIKPPISKISWIGGSREDLLHSNHWQDVFEGVYLARDLINRNADSVTPQELVLVAKGISKRFSKVKLTAFDKKRIEKEKMGLLLAVNRGSHIDPAFIILAYKGDPKSKDHTVVVGKGVTYDTGGLNLKPTGFMEKMKCDMSGAAAALGTILSCAKLNLKKNVTAVIPTTENAIDASSYKPGDVYTSYSGKTVEIGNTDAEGRLILADALAYAAKNLKPTRIVDFATLTGAIVVALGEEVTGLMSNNKKLVDNLTQAGLTTYERVWEMPLYEEYRKQLDSDIADIKNIGARTAGSITAAYFLKEFVGDTPWAHLDIAGTAYLSKKERYLPKNASGVGVRLMVEYLQNS